jgi:cytochrome c-type biogenesis protein CcmF
LPLHYRLAATWGSHEGSILLWTLMLSLWTVAVSLFSRHLPEEMVARVLSVMGIISVGFLLFMLLTLAATAGLAWYLLTLFGVIRA